MEFWEYWWLIFPIGGFAMGAFGMWMGYKRQKDVMDLMRTYAAQGKDPAEIAKLMAVADPGTAQAQWAGATAWGGPMAYGRYWRRWGPYRDWRRLIVFTCLAVGFGVASRYAEHRGTEHAFTLVAIIMGVLALGSLLTAILSTVFARNLGQNGQ